MENFVLFAPTACYIDPSAVSGLIMGISGAVIAVGAVITILVNKAKKKARELHINVDGNKEVEEELVINNEEKKDEVVK